MLFLVYAGIVAIKGLICAHRQSLIKRWGSRASQLVPTSSRLLGRRGHLDGMARQKRLIHPEAPITETTLQPVSDGVKVLPGGGRRGLRNKAGLELEYRLIASHPVRRT